MIGNSPAADGRVRYLHAFKSHWLLILAITGAALVVAAAVVVTATKRYEAQADIQITALPVYANDALQGLDVFRQPADGSSPAVTAARLFGSRQYAQALRRSLGPAGSAVQLDVTPLSQADVVSVTAAAPSASLAAQAADRFAQIVLARRKTLFQQQLHQRISQVSAQIAAIPNAARQTDPAYATLAGQLGALRSWLGASDPSLSLLTPAVAFELVNPRVTREDELALTHRLPVLARVPRLPAQTVREYLLGRSKLPAHAWKAYRTLGAVLGSAGGDGELPRSILVTSASAGDGKTLTAVNLAIALAGAGKRVTLVDADFHRPMVGTIFGVPAGRDGVSRLLGGQSGDVRSGIVEAPSHAGLGLLLANGTEMHQLHLFDRARVRRLLDRLGEESDVVVIDSPPLPEVAEAVALAEAAEAVVCCVRIGHTRRDKLADLRELLARRGVSPLGFFVTSRRRSQPGQDDYGYALDIDTTPKRGAVRTQEPATQSRAV